MHNNIKSSSSDCFFCGIFLSKKIEVAIRPVRSGNLQAFADVTFNNGVQLKFFRIIQQPGQRAWVSVPQASWTGKDGKIAYQNLLSLPDDALKAIREAILAEWAVHYE
jgi:DNA-binding cell septation regulator SpoVG